MYALSQIQIKEKIFLLTPFQHEFFMWIQEYM
jgi:hypothetical protein